MNDAILNNYQRWTERAIADVDVINELKDIAENEGKIEDAFYKDLAFGTGGLRGVIGAGTNRLNVYTVAKASQGLADSEGIDGLPKSDVLKFFLEDNCSIVVRPSGTEPKLKAYISVSAATKEEAQVVEGELARAVEEKMQKEKKLFYYPFDDKSLMVPFSSYRWGGWHKRQE